MAYRDYEFIKKVRGHFQNSSVAILEEKELAAGVVAIRTSSGYNIYFDRHKWDEYIKAPSIGDMGILKGSATIPPLKDFSDALKLGKKSLKSKRGERWIDDIIL